MKINSFPIQKIPINAAVNRSENDRMQVGSDCLVSADIPKFSQEYYKAVNNIVSFKSLHMKSLTHDIIGNVREQVVHDTFFFRDLEELEFVRDYVKENFPEGTHIADFACSIGEETHSLAIVLDDINKDRKIKITGYDISPKVIDIAQKGEYQVVDEFNEGFLLEKDTKNPRLSKYKRKFFNSFEPTNSQPGRNILRRKKEVFGDIVNFEVRDICEAEDENIPKNTGVVLFKNGWYHFTDFFPDDVSPVPTRCIDTLDMIAGKINKILPENGLLVVGSFQRDHLVTGYEPTEMMEVNGKYIKAVTDSQFHSVLKKNGFTPVYYELCPDWSCPTTIYLPTIWKKVKDVCK